MFFFLLLYGDQNTTFIFTYLLFYSPIYFRLAGDIGWELHRFQVSTSAALRPGGLGRSAPLPSPQMFLSMVPFS